MATTRVQERAYLSAELGEIQLNCRDFSRFSEEWQLFDVGRFEGVTFLRPSVRPSDVRGEITDVRWARWGACTPSRAV